ncbi:MAG: S41 family peptidase [Chloroflexi bacterium]|nr:MAG: S41 family peptidase [Chloroflexota bacterium]
MSYRLKGVVRLVLMGWLTAIVITTAYLAGFATQQISEIEARQASAQPRAGETTTFDLFWEAWDILRHNFYGPLPNSEEMVRGAIRGVIDTLNDPYTAYAGPAEARLFEESLNGNFEGIGATVEKRDGQIVIVAPLPNTPAERAGLRTGDIILAVDGEPLLDADLWQAVAKIRGPRGTRVTLTVLRPGQSEPFEVTIQRERIEIPVVESRIIRENGAVIAYIKLFRFSNNAPRRFRSELRQLLSENPQGVILDLRDNPGGYLHVAVQIASEFIGEGLILTERGKNEEREHPAQPGGLLTGQNALPLAVLVNRGSASASEIVAGAIQDHHRGVLIGETTFGKGSVQISHDLSDGSNLRVTTARWFTPNGRQIHELGLEPDIAVPRTDEQIDAGVDPQLDRAIQYLLEQIQSD